MPATVIVGAPWGDEGKGKIVDLLAQSSDVVCRYQGGPNAGHTIVRDGERFALHHIPSGILYGGKTCVLGARCVIHPALLVAELDELQAPGGSTPPPPLPGNEPLEPADLADRMESCAARLRPYVADTSLLVDRALREGRRVLLEGAQGTLLDLDHGTYPFVTSSGTVAGAAAVGVGIGPNRIDAIIGVAKAYVTRVGEGPFPTEIEGPDQERVRELGAEFGTTTGRQRRCGWLDLVALRYAVRLNGITSLALTKLDVLSGFAEIPVCVRYLLPDGSETSEFPAHQSDFHHCRPVYETLPGWQEPIADGLPDAARAYVGFVERELGVEISLVGTGAERERVVALS